MPRTPAKITQADVARAIRAAKQAGAVVVEVKPDGTVLVHLSPTASTLSTEPPMATAEEIVL
jgi:hypothetical protein